MKTNKIMRVASVLLVAVLLTTCAISGTFAKYTTDATATGTARVALWDIKLDGKDITVAGSAQSIEIDLFEYADTGVDVNGAADDAFVIAPGTAGSFALEVVNDSEVKAEYTITLSEDNDDNIPVVYSLDGTTWYDSIAELMTAESGDLADQPLNFGDGADASASHTIYWKWTFNHTDDNAHDGQTDANDTTLGIGGAAEVVITASITVTQVNE